MATFFNNKAHAATVAAGASRDSKASLDKSADKSQPWVEKYRPKKLSDVTAQDHTVTILQRTLQASNLPHMLFYGPPGTGKTSTILALAKELYGPEMFKSRVLELNASDERGISIVREKVKNFARMQLSNPPPNYRDRYPCPSFKIIVLDEADSMTQDAQSALRRTMETYSKITRFCLICNYVTRIIDPLASRCSKFRFKLLDQENAKNRLADIASNEKVKVEDGVLDKLIECSDGDLRKAITYLQSASRLFNSSPRNGSGRVDAGTDDDNDVMEIDVPSSSVVTVKSIEEIAGVIPPGLIDNLAKAMRPATRSGVVYDNVAQQVEDLVADGWSAAQTQVQLFQKIIRDDEIPNKQKSKMLLVFSDIDKRLVDGADEHLTILDLALQISKIYSEI